jgi:hypothetical protein
MTVDLSITKDELNFLYNAVLRGCMCDHCTIHYYNLREKLAYMKEQMEADGDNTPLSNMP